MDRMDSFCPRYHFAVELIGRRWTGAILRALLAGKTTYAEIRLAVPRLSDTMLSERLRELQREGIVERTVIPDARRTVEYRLTAKGQALEAVVAELSRWAEEWLEDEDATSGPATSTPPYQGAPQAVTKPTGDATVRSG
jgi:DNA-binding HxlR family transcriptional regulator